MRPKGRRGRLRRCRKIIWDGSRHGLKVFKKVWNKVMRKEAKEQISGRNQQ
jgi:hypothetical protein